MNPKRSHRSNVNMLATALILGSLVAICGCGSIASAGERTILEEPTPQVQYEIVQPQPRLQYQTQTKTVIEPQTVTEQVPVTKTRLKTVMVPQTVCEAYTDIETRQHTVNVAKTVQERVAVCVAQPPRLVAVPVQTVAIGLRAPGAIQPVRNVLNRLRR